jgi:hypothetical protein
MMDTQSFINLLAGSALLVSGWFLREMWQAVKELRKDLHDLEVSVVPRTEFMENIRHIENICSQIFTRIDDLRRDRQ